MKITIQGGEVSPINLEVEDFCLLTRDKQGNNVVFASPRYHSANPDIILSQSTNWQEQIQKLNLGGISNG